MKYRGYKAVIDYDDADEILVGRVVGLNDILSFHGTTTDELRSAFKDVVDSYIAHCAESGKEPEKQFSGKFVLRSSPEQHRDLSLDADVRGISLNELVLNKLFPQIPQAHVIAKKKGTVTNSRKRRG